MHVVYFLYYRLAGPGTILGLNRLNDGLQDPGHLKNIYEKLYPPLKIFHIEAFVLNCAYNILL